MNINVLIVGSGGREHAIGAKLKESPLLNKLYFAPGNGGTSCIGENIDINVTQVEEIKNFALAKNIGLVFIGPELPLSLGLADLLQESGILAFGPTQKAAMLESSKAFSKNFMEKYKLPTAKYFVFENCMEATKYLEQSDYPVVIKADGLASGKGVIICPTKQEALETIDSMMNGNKFGIHGKTIVVEEFLQGKEVSLLCFTDGKTIIPMDTASDYKRAYDGDKGLNTGGMGSVSPSPFVAGEGAFDDIVNGTLKGIQSEGLDYCGVIYIGLILTKEGSKIIEYNARFGDPETQAILPRLKNDLLEIMLAVCNKKLEDIRLSWSNKKAVSVVLAAQGYPAEYATNMTINIPEDDEDCFVFHAGTVLKDNEIKASGGRILAVTAIGDSFEIASGNTYKHLEKISCPNSFYRTDIGEV